MPENKEKEVVILDINKLPSAKPERLGKFDYVITYRLPTGQIRIISIPAEELEGASDEEKEEKIREYIKRDLAEWSKWVGKRITI